MGSAAAWQLTRRGVDVTLLEQFEPGHTRGGSHGSSRIVRLSYDDPFYVELAATGYDRWAELEDDCGEQLLTWTGVVDHGDPATVGALAAAMEIRNHAVETVEDGRQAFEFLAHRLSVRRLVALPATHRPGEAGCQQAVGDGLDGVAENDVGPELSE